MRKRVVVIGLGIFGFNIDDLVKSQKSRHSCESSPPKADRRRPCESREPEIYESGFLFSQETLDSRFRGNDENGAKRTFYEAINIAKELYQNGFEVIAIDKNKEMIQEIKDFSTKAVLADGTDKGVFELIGMEVEDMAIVSFGEDLAASTLITLHLKEMHIKNIIVKAPNEDHKRILEKVGATEVIIPEKEMARKVARSLISPNVLDYIPLSQDFTICEIAPPPSFVGKTIGDIQLRKKHHIGVIAIRDVLTDQVQMIPSADFMIKDSDILVVIGKEEDIRKLT